MNVQASTLLEYGMTRSQVAALGLLPGEEPPRADTEPACNTPKSEKTVAQRNYEYLLQSGKKCASAYVSVETLEAVDRLAKERKLSRAAFIALVLDRCAEIGKRLPEPTPAEDPQAVIARIASKHGFSVAAMKGRCRDARLVEPRHECMRVLRQMGLTLHEIGRALNRDHTTVHYALHRKVRK